MVVRRAGDERERGEVRLHTELYMVNKGQVRTEELMYTSSALAIRSLDEREQRR